MEPEISGRVIRLRRARHPLLARETAVPIDLTLGGDFDTLVITGPNTGGKTVTLKTIGLMCVMAACGLHIPAAGDSAVPVFSGVYRRHRRRAEHRAEFVDLFFAHDEQRPHT